jgi:hypothetical protein
MQACTRSGRFSAGKNVIAKGLLAATAAGLLLSGCAGSSAPITDRFTQLFGSGSSSTANAQLVGTPPAPFGGSGNAAAGEGAQQGGAYQNCPAVAIREGASTLQVGTKGNSITDNNDLRYQGTIVRNARDCTLFGGQVNTRVGIQGRVIVGPAGAPSTVDLPIRVAVVQEGVQPKTIVTKLYRQQVDLGGMDNVPFSFVAEDLSFPVPPPNVVDAYVIYIGFDPEGARTPPPRQRGSRRG